MTDPAQYIRILEAVLFAAAEPLDEASLAARLPNDADLPSLLAALSQHYHARGVTLVQHGGRWSLRTAPDLAPYLRVEMTVRRKLSRAALETLAIVAYHQPVTRAEVEEIRGVSLSRGTLDILLEAGWVRPGRRRRTPGRPLTWVTTDSFLDHFDLVSLDDLPGVEDLKSAGLLDKRPALGTISAVDAEEGSTGSDSGADEEAEASDRSLGN